MQCYTQLLSPTALTHSIALPLLHCEAKNLVVAKGSILQVYDVTSISPSPTVDKQCSANTPARPTNADCETLSERIRLVLLAEYPVAAAITSMAPVKIPGSLSGGDALLISCKDAKMSLLEWDPENFRLGTLSIHYYDKAEILTSQHISSCESSYYKSKVTVDPTGRCAALCFGSRHLAILPFPDTSLNGTDEDAAAADDTIMLDHETTNGAHPTSTQTRTPYAASFVMSLTALDQTLTHPLDLAFLFEYRDPTFGIISSDRASSYAIRNQRKDILSYSVITFDVEQRTATTLLTIKGLPSSLTRLVPLPRPIGGALLIGPDELIHVDQSGKTTGIAVNEFARATSACALHDQSSLDLRLDHCLVGTLDPTSGTLLVALDSGRLALLAFQIDGRSVSGLQLHPVAQTHGGMLGPPSPTSITTLTHSSLLIGSDQGNHAVLSWSQLQPDLPSRKRDPSSLDDEDQGNASDDLEGSELDDGDDDDLYGGQVEHKGKRAATNSQRLSDPSRCVFRLDQSLQSLAPINSVCFGHTVTPQDNISPVADLGLVASVGRQSGSRLVALSRSLTPSTVLPSDMVDTKLMWALRPSKVHPGSANGVPPATHDRFLVRHHATTEGEDMTILLTIDHDGSTLPKEVDGTDFEREGETLDMAVLGGGSRIVQVRKSEIRIYDTDFGLLQIYPILDSATDDELQVTHTSIIDPFLMTIRSDQTVQVLSMDSDGELQEVEMGAPLSTLKLKSGCLYKEASQASNEALLWLLDIEGGLHIYQVPNLSTPVYSASNLSALPPVLTTENRQRRAASREDLVELLVADLGDKSSHEPFLILRSANSEIIIYKPFHYPAAPTDFVTNLRFRKLPGLNIVPADNSCPEYGSVMRAMANVGGYRAVSVHGATPAFILKEPTGLPCVVKLAQQEGARSICAIDSSTCEQGFAIVDAAGAFRQCQLPQNTTYEHAGWTVRELGVAIPEHEIHQIAYHAASQRYILVTSEQVDYTPSEEEQKQPGYEENLRLRPQIGQYTLHLLSPTTGTITDTYCLRPHEMVTSLVSAPLETSEVTHERRELVAVGTMLQYGESNASKGTVHVLDVVDVVPDPEKPDTNKGFRLVTMEETKTGITAMMGIDGMLGTAQMLKLVFRGLKDESSQCLPVAFLDAPSYTTVLKTLGGTNMWLAGDAKKGLWFGGFSEDPYKISLFGQSRPNIEVAAAEFLPQAGALFLVLVDTTHNLHVLQFDPENPASLSGRRLLHRASIHIGAPVTNMLLIPSRPGQPSPPSQGGDAMQLDDQAQPPAPASQILITSSTGAVALLSPLAESSYRRLSALASSSLPLLEHTAGLNPRSYRHVAGAEDAVRGPGVTSSSAFGAGGGGLGSGVASRVVVDGDLVGRVAEFGAGKRAEILGRAGIEGVGGFVRDFGAAAGAGLGWF